MQNLHHKLTVYFETLASKFFKHSNTEKHFFRIAIEEFYQALHTKIRYPAMILMPYSIRGQAKSRDTKYFTISVHLLLLNHATQMLNNDEVNNIFDSMEDVAMLLEQQMCDDSYSSEHPFMKFFDFDSLTIENVQDNTLNNFGVEMKFDIVTHYQYDTLS